jgi:CHAT domain-containing protein
MRVSRDQGPGRILALAGPDDEDGASRPSAVAALEDIRSRWRGIRVETADGSSSRVTPERLQGYALLHLVTRARLDDLHPWFSGVLVERASATEADPWWRAFQVAATHMDARLVVLPSCEPARGHAASEEGAVALATAVLSAGADAVIVNLWPVDATSTARWASAFYAGLARGETVARSMVSARQALRADPSTRAPHFWAGFVLYGNGDVRMPLQARPRWWWPALAGSGVVVAALALAVGTRRRRPANEPAV